MLVCSSHKPRSLSNVVDEVLVIDEKPLHHLRRANPTVWNMLS